VSYHTEGEMLPTELSSYYRAINGSFLLRIYNIKNYHDILDTRMMVVNHFKVA